MPADVALDIATQIATNLGGSYTLGTNVFAGPVRPSGATVPKRAVFVLTSGGEPSVPYRETAVPYTEKKAPRVQARIRCDAEDFAVGEALAVSVRDAANFLPPSGYIECRAVESSPNYLGRDPEALHEWSVNFRVEIEE